MPAAAVESVAAMVLEYLGLLAPAAFAGVPTAGVVADLGAWVAQGLAATVAIAVARECPEPQPARASTVATAVSAKMPRASLVQ